MKYMCISFMSQFFAFLSITEPQNVEELVSLYHKKQLGLRMHKAGSSSAGPSSLASSPVGKTKRSAKTNMYSVRSFECSNNFKL